MALRDLPFVVPAGAAPADRPSPVRPRGATRRSCRDPIHFGSIAMNYRGMNQRVQLTSSTVVVRGNPLNADLGGEIVLMSVESGKS